MSDINVIILIVTIDMYLLFYSAGYFAAYLHYKHYKDYYDKHHP